MTNFEKYKDTVLSIVDKRDFVAIVNDKPTTCSGAICKSCKNNDYIGKCTAAFIKWLYEEYQEKPKLSERAYHFLKSLPDGARIRECGPHLQIQTQDVCVISSYRNYNYVPELPPLVNEVWYEVSEILKWEVEE